MKIENYHGLFYTGDAYLQACQGGYSHWPREISFLFIAMCEPIPTRLTCALVCQNWARACREMRLWDKRRAVLIRMGNMNEKRHQTFGMTRWKEQTARARDAATMHNGANALIDALYVKRAVRRSFRHWVECVLLEQISDAFGGVEIVTSAHHEQVLSVAEAAAKPYVGRAAAAAAAGNFGEAFKQAHLGTTDADLRRGGGRQQLDERPVVLLAE